MNKNEVGRRVAINAGEDISTADNYQMIFDLNKYDLVLGPADGVIRPDVDLTFTPCGETEEVTYLANQYLYYPATKAGDFPYAGEYFGRAKIEYVGPTASFYGDRDTFEVGE